MKWIGFTLMFACSVLAAFHLEDGQGGRQVSRFDDLAFGTGMIGVMAGCVLTIYAIHSEERRRKLAGRRGFEVKLNTGETPVLPRKDDDHG